MSDDQIKVKYFVLYPHFIYLILYFYKVEVYGLDHNLVEESLNQSIFSQPEKLEH